MPTTKAPKPGTVRRRQRKAALEAGKVPLAKQNHGDPYWAMNWGCACLTCVDARSKLNKAQYKQRKAAAAARAGRATTEGSK